MPEGPEVAFIAEQLNKELKSGYINDFDFIGGRYENHGPPELYDHFIERLPYYIDEVEYKGKLIVFHLTDSQGERWWIFNTLGMSGGWNVEKDKHAAIEIQFVDCGVETLYFNDQRRFGTIKFCKDEDEYIKKIKSIASGFLGKYQISFDEFDKNVKKHSSKNITKTLMDQKSICSGIGNYLISEICYLTGINPFNNFDNLSSKQIKLLYDTISKTIQLSYKAGGASIRNYSDLKGNDGAYTYSFNVYNQKQDPEGNEIHKKEGPHKRSLWISSKYDW
jgi:DNA-formamidopyrimidine glycosylase